MSIKINEPYPGYSRFSEYMEKLMRMSDEELTGEYCRLSEMRQPDDVSIVKKSILVDFIVRFDKEYLMK